MSELTTTAVSGDPRIRALIEEPPEGTEPTPGPGDDLFTQPARLLARRLQRGELTAVEALEAHLELILRLVAGPDGQGADVPPVPIAASRRYALEELRLAAAPTLPGIRVEASIRERIEEVAARAADAGARVVPAGTDEQGLPIGVQIVGPRWSEMRLLDIARALEGAGVLPGFRAPPLCG